MQRRQAPFVQGQLVWLALALVAGACSRNRMPPQAVPSNDDAWVQAACSPALADLSLWPRHIVGRLSIAVPPGYVVTQGQHPSLSVRSATRQSWAVVAPYRQKDAQATYDAMVLRPHQKRLVCRMTMSGYAAEVVATYEQGRYRLMVFWGETAWGEEGGTWVIGSLSSPDIETARELRTILHSIQPAGQR